MISSRYFSRLGLRDSILLFALANVLFAVLIDWAFSLPLNLGTVLLVSLLASLPIVGWGILIVAIAKTKVWRPLTQLKLPSSSLLFIFTNGLFALLYPLMLARHQILLLLALAAIASFGWAALFAAIAHTLHWSARTCFLVPAVVFVAAGSVQFLFDSDPTVVVLGYPIGLICMKLVHPELPWNHVAVPEPPITLFSTLRN